MSKISEMSRDELTNYCVDKKLTGSSFMEIVNMLNKNDIDKETKGHILKQLKTIDKVQVIEMAKEQKAENSASFLISIFVGVFMIAAGIFMYLRTSEIGVVYLFNIVLFLGGVYLAVKGIIGVVINRR